MTDLTVVGVVGGPEAGGRTTTAVSAVLDGTGAKTEILELSETAHADVVDAFARADAVVLGSPIYRASHTAALKALLEATERGKWGEKTAPLQGKAAAIVLTGATGHHFLAQNDLRNVLASFFAVQVLSPGLYLDHGGYVDRNTLTDESTAIAHTHGAALADLTAAVRGSEALRNLGPVI